MTHRLAEQGHDWSDTELAELQRLRCVCEMVPGWDFECSATDEGEPWCGIVDERSEFTLLHIARIGRRYIVVRPRQQRITVTMAAAVDQALEWLGRLQPHQLLFARSRQA